ncbi:MAG: zf-HC2 domain-containing protein [Anaerolineales bacterium]|nr:zf-HC2 domain-containing protein [Anaerolineales bacterium]
MKKNINCGALLETLSDYIDGTLREALCKELERHIADCDDCRVVVDTAKKTIDLYHETAAQTSVPVDVRERLFHRLNLDDFIQQDIHRESM